MNTDSKKPKKFCGVCIWYKETKPYFGRCLKYEIMTRMENYKFYCKEWAPVSHPAGGSDSFG